MIQLRRGLVPWEVLAIVIAALIGPSLTIPVLVPLMVVASASRWVRGRGFAEVVRGPPMFAVIGLASGAIALALALAVATPFAEALVGRAVVWGTFPIVRGSTDALAAVAVIVAVTALAAELVLRGWIVERALELGCSTRTAIVIGAAAEALVTDTSFEGRLGAGAIGLGLGWMYVAGGRSVVAPICARLAFSLGALALEALQLVG